MGAIERDGLILYKAVVHMVLLYCSENWDIMEEIMMVLEASHNYIARRITGNMYWCVEEEGWEWHPSEEAIEALGLCPMQEYVQR